MSRAAALVLSLAVLAACSQPEDARTTTSATSPREPVPTTGPSPVIDEVPVVWFAPLPPLPVVEGRPFTGADDFIELFEPDAPWAEAAERVHVFKLYGEWVGYATPDQLRTVVRNAQERGFALAMEFGPLDAEGCGDGIEGFSGVAYAVSAAERVKAAGGELHLLAMDEPYYYGHFYDGPNACRWSAEKIAQEIGQFADAMREVFPNILIGDTEAMAGPAGAAQLSEWIDTFERVNGDPLAFLHLDVDWSRPGWADEVASVHEHGTEAGVPIGMIYAGNAFDRSDEEWLSAAGERVKLLEIGTGVVPDHVLFQSWNDKPDRVLPESEEFTFTNFVNDYFGQKSELGFRREGEGANLALGKPVRTSGVVDGLTGAMAVDGDRGTLWNSGGGPVQWIEIDLGDEYSVGEIELTIAQDPPGSTTHRLLLAGAGGQFVEAAVFEQDTAEGEALVFTPVSPAASVRFVRVETTASPSWVAWREIEVIDAGS